jgi:hypothetical protein
MTTLLIGSNRLSSRLQMEAFNTTSAKDNCFVEFELKHGRLDDFFNNDPGGLNTWHEFLTFLQGKVLWTDAEVFVVLRPGRVPVVESEYYRPIISLDTSYFGPKVDIYAPVHSYIKNTLEGLLLLLSVSKVPHLEIVSTQSENLPLPCGIAFLEYFLTQNLHVARLGLERLSLTSSQCQALASHIMPETLTLDLVLTNCSLLDDGDALTQLVQRSHKYPTMGLCFSRTFLGSTAFYNMCQGLPLSKSLQSLQLIYMDLPDDHLQLLASSLSNNTSLAWLDLRGNAIRDPTWKAICQALCNKPRLKYLGLANTAAVDNPVGCMSAEQRRQRTGTLLQTVRSNIDLYSVHVSIREHNDDLLQVVDALLLIHRHRPRAVALTQMQDTHTRGGVLVKALAAIRFSPNLLWSFLSENLDLVVMSQASI